VIVPPDTVAASVNLTAPSNRYTLDNTESDEKPILFKVTLVTVIGLAVPLLNV